MSGGEREAGAELARRAARRQGLPDRVEDSGVLRQVATIAGLRCPQREGARSNHSPGTPEDDVTALFVAGPSQASTSAILHE
jgi:hypothetical protein